MCPLLEVENLVVSFGDIEAVRGVSFHVSSTETVALVGESGCGKTVTALAILHLLGKSTTSGSIRFGGREILHLDEETLCRYRGASIAAIFQDPMTSLNPTMTIGKQIMEAIERHQNKKSQEAYLEAIQLLKAVDIDDPRVRIHQYPHQLSGGMRQRVMLAIALACRPQLLIADEPTTSLDVTTQDQILQLLKKLQREYGMSLLLITHDFGVVSGMADRVVVMRDGKVVEEGTPEMIYHKPMESYTRNLVQAHEWEVFASKPKPKPLIEIKSLKKVYRDRKRVSTAIRNATLSLNEGESLALVGESGSGKSTLARLILQLERQSEGEILFKGAKHASLRPREIQAVFQNPYATLDPRMTVKQILEEPFIIHKLPYGEDRIISLLESVGLSRPFLSRYPHALSGGQRQRIGIARALAVQPELLIFDEPLSALDLAMQQQILLLLRTLKEANNLTYLFITHDLSVAKAIADRVAVMFMGEIVEIAQTAEFFAYPKHPYSQMLLAAVPFRDPRMEKQREPCLLQNNR